MEEKKIASEEKNIDTKQNVSEPSDKVNCTKKEESTMFDEKKSSVNENKSAESKKRFSFFGKRRKSEDVSAKEIVENKKDSDYNEKHVFTWHNLKEYFKKEKAKYGERKAYVKEFLMEKPIKSSVVLSFIMLMFVEAMSRRSFGNAVIFAYSNIGKFLFNWMIVIAPFLLSLVISKRIATYVMASVIWIIIGTVDFLMLSNRTTPFTGVDLQSVLSFNEMAIAFEYMGVLKSILVVLGIILVIGLVVCLFIFTPKFKRKLPIWKSSVIVVASWVLIYVAILVGIKTDVLSMKFSHLATSYKEQGLPYCFIVTVVDTGISKPNDYSEESISLILDSQNNKNEKKVDKKPNVIFLQLESFIDPMDIDGLSYSSDPIPYFRELRNNYSSGYFEVPTVVAGTCNTEFEVLTGMSLEFFGPGEYPYKTILKDNVCESMAFDLKKQGYTSHAIHNYVSAFYGRNNVYANMGFDTFTGIEMMSDYTKTANNRWVKDDVLIGCIKDCLDSTEKQDLLYTISVQCHGTYDQTLPEGEKVIDVTGEENKDLANQLTYYVNMEKQEDDFIRNLTKMLSDYPEDVVLVMYGDHIPGLNLSDDNLKCGSMYYTPYVVWDNMGLKKKDMNIKSYQMASEVFSRININDGTIFKYHQVADKTSDDYLKNLNKLQYDMLYGKKYAYEGEQPFERTNIKYDVRELKIGKVNYDEKDKILYVEGERFNPHTNVYINGEKVNSKLVSSSLLKVSYDKSKLSDKDGDSIKVGIKYQNADGDVYVESEEVEYKFNVGKKKK